MNAGEYKKFHESFMQNNYGSSSVHTACCILFTVLTTIIVSLSSKLDSYLQYLFEYAVITFPLILIHTVFSQQLYVYNFILTVFLFYYCTTKICVSHVTCELDKKNTYRSGNIQTITCMRGLTYLITVFSILAVDFQIFPRYLAKTEQFGYSLMDSGVGLFILMSGLVHKSNFTNSSSFKHNFKLIAILLVLGVSRYLSVKQLDYQEHVTEYGVHWNFFFTLAVTKIIASLILLLFHSHNTLVVSMLTMIAHECCLFSGLQKWALSDVTRDDLISANREGITSTLGYVAMYLFAVHIKSILTNEKIQKKTVLGRISLYCLSLCSLVAIVSKPASRILANTSYCIYVSAIFIFILILFYLVEAIFTDFHVPVTISAINNNGLLYFLCANLLTGAINLCVKTLLVEDWIAFSILNVYMIITTVLVVFLNRIGLKI